MLAYFILINLFITSPHKVVADTTQDNIQTIEKYVSSNTNDHPPLYRLGPGDKLVIKIFRFENLNSEVKVLPDGSINLPRIGALNILDLTIQEAKNKITNSYAKIIRRPIVYLDLTSTRPIKISVSGEVHHPGIYTIALNDVNTLSNIDGGESTTISTSGWPTIVDAIQKGGGVTSSGDLRNITLIRKSNDGIKNEELKVNFWNTLKYGTPIKNHFIYDGDSILVKKVSNVDNNERSIIASSSFSPSLITVNVIGEVFNPGKHELVPNSPLMQSINIAGGHTANSNKKEVTLLRLNNNGTITKKKYSYNANQSTSIATNPPLKDGDTIIIEKDSWSKSNEKLKKLTEPLTPFVNIFSVYRLLGN